MFKKIYVVRKSIEFDTKAGGLVTKYFAVYHDDTTKEISKKKYDRIMRGIVNAN